MGFGLVGIKFFFFTSLSGDYRFTNYLEILNFLFSNILPGGVSTCYLPSSRVSTSRNIKLKNCKILFLTFSVDFLKFSPLNLWYFEDVSIKYPKQFLYYIDFICKRHVKKNSSLNFMSSVGFQAPKIWMLFWKIYCGANFEVIFRQE